MNKLMVNAMHRLAAYSTGSHRPMVRFPYDGRLLCLLNKLVDFGYLLSVKTVHSTLTSRRELNVYLRYGKVVPTLSRPSATGAAPKFGAPAIRGVKIFNTPGKPSLTASVQHVSLLGKQNPHFTYFLQASNGALLSHRQALKMRVGGIVLMSIW